MTDSNSTGTDPEFWGQTLEFYIVWRTLTDDREKDNTVLDYFLQHKEGDDFQSRMWEGC